MHEEYMRKLAKCSVNELMSLKEHIAGDMNRRNAAFMLQCVVAALAAKVGSAC